MALIGKDGGFGNPVVIRDRIPAIRRTDVNTRYDVEDPRGRGGSS
jgi:hypothetical protein